MIKEDLALDKPAGQQAASGSQTLLSSFSSASHLLTSTAEVVAARQAVVCIDQGLRNLAWHQPVSH